MTKREFLMALNDALGSMTGDDRSAAIKYYSDYIDDAGEENMDQVLAQLGTPQQVAASILADAGLSGASHSEQKNAASSTPPPAVPYAKSGLPWWALLLLIIVLSPAWMPLLGVVVGIFAAVLGVLLSLFAATFAVLVAGAVCLFIGLLTLFAEPMAGILATGIGCVLLGVGLLCTLLCVFLCRTVIPAVARWLRRCWRGVFRKKGGNVA